MTVQRWRASQSGRHDAARAEAIAQVNDVIGVAQQRQVDLKERRRKAQYRAGVLSERPEEVLANLRRQLDRQHGISGRAAAF